MKKNVIMLLVMALLLTMMPLSIAAEDVGATEGTYINVYDAQSLGTALMTEGANIVLWGDITYSETVAIACNSLDLNGYTLTCTKRMTIQNNSEFTILDSVYDSESKTSTGSMVVSSNINIETSTFIIQSGIFQIRGGIHSTGNIEIYDGIVDVNGLNGKNGKYGANGVSNTSTQISVNNPRHGKDGGDGRNGENAIDCKNIYFYGGNIIIRGGHGGRGGDGGDGYSMPTTALNFFGGNGGNAGNGGNGGIGINATESVIIYNASTINIFGGYGGSGGNGGDGGKGAGGLTDYTGLYYIAHPGRNGGDAGNGGNSGWRGKGIQTNNLVMHGGNVYCAYTVDEKYEQKGKSGNFGEGGRGSVGTVGGESYWADDGKPGLPGSDGNKAYYGAAIDANVTVTGGVLTATAGEWAAAIGGSGYADSTNATNVFITGGKVIVKGGENAFDIGSGYDGTKYGTAGKLEVTGGILEFHTFGKATNVSNPIFKNCTVTGAGAFNHEGTYNANGKFSISVTDIIINPTDCVGYDSVTLTASLKISRSTNITTPVPKGYISFKIDGLELGTAKIANAVASEGVITATATTNWIAVEGEKTITAEYVSGTNDQYASAGVFNYSSNIAEHSHSWDSEFTVDLEPTCITTGLKSVRCNICLGKKFVEIPVSEHNYVNNKCSVCEAYKPVVVFKNYDGTILSSTYYDLGDTVVVPSNPSRPADEIYTYSFAGWDKEVVACAGNTTYIATYNSTYIDYTVAFKNYDGSMISSSTYHYGEAVVIPSNPTRTADNIYIYEFAGWDSEVTACLGNKTYIATFNKTYVDYTIVFENFDGSVISTETYHYGEEVIAPANPTKPSDNTYSYQFDGWNTSVVACVGDAIYTANYKPVYINYTITFLDYNGSVLGTSTYHYGDTIESIAAPLRAADNTYTYTFAGWDKAVGTCVGNETYTATYISEYVDYTITFKNYNGGVIYRSTCHYGEEIAASFIPTRDGYEFKGWSTIINGEVGYKPNEVIVVEQDLTLYAIWEIKTYTVVYNANGGIGAPKNTTKEHFEDYAISSVVPMRSGYDFNGWLGSDGKTYDAGDIYYDNADLTLQAIWEPKYLVMTYDANGGESSEANKQVQYTKSIGKMTIPTRNGYTFAGWFTEKVGGIKLRADDIVDYIGDFTVYAHWTPNDYTIFFDANGGKVSSESKVVTYASGYDVLPVPTYTGYTLEGWYTEKEGGMLVTRDTVVTTASNHILYAHWKANVYLVFFDANGGDCDKATQNVTFNSEYGELPVPTRTGYTFVCWSRNKNVADVVTDKSNHLTASDITLYAIWSANTYKLTFDSLGGKIDIADVDVTYDSVYGNLPVSLKPNYIFGGWFFEKEYKNKLTSDMIVSIASDHTVYAMWIPATFAIVYNANGGEDAPTEQTKSLDVDLVLSSDIPTRKGYKFLGWATSTDGAVVYAPGATYFENANLTLYAVWEAIKYGDSNGDDEISIKDAVLLAQYLAGWCVSIDSKASDCNGDGKVDIKDAVLLAQSLAGWAVTLG